MTDRGEGTPPSLLHREVDFSWAPKVRDALLRVLWPLTPLVALLVLFPWPFRDPDIATDYSWSLVLQHLHGSDLVFGRDMMLNYGAWGFVFFGYLPETRTLVMLAWVLLSQLMAIGVVVTTRTESRSMLGLACAWCALFVLSFPLPDVRVLAFAPVLFALGAFEPERKHLAAAELALASALGWVVTIKFSTFVMAIAFLLSHTWDQWALRRRLSPVIPVFVAALLLAIVAAGDPVESVFEWVQSSMQNVVGYGTAGVASDRFHERHPISLFVAGAAALGVAMAIHLFRVRGWKAIVPLTALATSFGVLLKAGYVRHDAGHQINSSLVFLAFVLLLAPGMAAKGRLAEKAVFGLALLIAVYSANVTVNIDRRRDLNIAVAEQLSEIKAAATQFEAGERGLREFHERKMERIRNKFPLPMPIREPVDVYSYMQSVAYAHGLELSPRPAFQSYFAWTPFLARANEKHLRGPRAAETILFAIEPIDGRFPSFEDSLSYPTLISRYEPWTSTDDFLLLRRRAVPVDVRLEPVAVVESRVGEWIEVPPSDVPLWATVQVRLAPEGRLVRLALRPPEIRLLARVGGAMEDYRFIPDYGEMGFVVSPVLRDHRDFETLFSGVKEPNRTMDAFRITTGSPERDRSLLEPAIRVEYSAIRFTPPSGRGAAVGTQAPE